MVEGTEKDGVSIDLTEQIFRSEHNGNSDKPVPSIGDDIVVPTYLKTERKEKKEIELLNAKVSRLENVVRGLEETNSEQGDKLVTAWEDIKKLKFKLHDEEGAKIRAQQDARQIERNQENLRRSLISFLGLDHISMD